MDGNVKAELEAKASKAEDIVCKYMPLESTFQKTVVDAMEYSLMAGGKRLRPVLMRETFELFGGQGKVIEPFMAAIEMIHTYSLVHDDLPAMDNDMLRRGKPTTHAVYGEAMAILAGDALLNYAFETALKAMDSEVDSKLVVKALRVLANKAGIYGMIGGQVADVEAEKRQLEMTEDKIHFIYDLKTGGLIEASMMIGAILAGASDSQVKAVESIASKIGFAFQIQDDILDIEGDEVVLGKPIGSDERNEKATYLTFKGIEKSKEEVKSLTEQAINELDSLSLKNDFLRDLLNYLVYRDN